MTRQEPSSCVVPAATQPVYSPSNVPDSKTETGIRIVELSPDLAEAFVDHLDRLRRAGNRIDPDDYVVQNVRGGRISRQRVAEIVREAATLATERRSASGLPPLPRTTPHSLRRTYISIALLANRFDVKWVMSQVGHADSKMTLDVYAQLEQRVKREHGVRFDAVVRDARVQLHGAQMRPEKAPQRRRGAERPGIEARDE
jgi:integrase